MALAGVVELVEELQSHITLAQQGLAREEFAEGAIMRPTTPEHLYGQPRVVVLEEITEFCALVQSSLTTILNTAKQTEDR